MSIDLYLVRLWWSNGRGEAKFYRAVRWLNEQPALGMAYEEIDFAPEAGTQQIRHPREGMCDISQPERVLIMRFLRSLRRP